MKESNPEDFSKFLGNSELSRKQKLIEECENLDISIYIDDESETSDGVYSELRAVASEAELERRLNAKNTIRSANHSKYIAILALVISLISLIKSFWQET